MGGVSPLRWQPAYPAHEYLAHEPQAQPPEGIHIRSASIAVAAALPHLHATHRAPSVDRKPHRDLPRKRPFFGQVID